MYQALYRKYRPQTFDDVVGQLAVTQTLKNQLLTGRMSHAYLFTGSRGTGKTSSAKILAKAVNCENNTDGNPCNCCRACRAIDSGACMDVLEIDAASNNGVDHVRDLRDDAIYSPSQVRKRVYIVDEVHMLSLAAFNALLKIIEEPPEHLLFILATTELHKVPATILSRCQRFSFRRISQEDIAARLQYVAYQERIDLTEGAARILARMADGGMRDALSLLDQCASASAGELDETQVYRCLGIAGIRDCAELMNAVADQDVKTALALLNRIYAEGKDMAALLDELACLTRDLMILQTAPKEGIGMLSGVASDADAQALVGRFSPGELVRCLNLLQTTLAGFSRSASRRMDAELCIVNLCCPELSLDAEALNARLARVEHQVANGVVQPKAAAPVTPDPAPAQPAQAPAEEPPVPAEPVNEAPVGFWADLSAQLRSELGPPLKGFLAPSESAPVKGIVQGNRVVLLCANDFTVRVVDKPDVKALVAQRASAMLGRQVTVAVVDRSSGETGGAMDSLLQFGRNHAHLITIQE